MNVVKTIKDQWANPYHGLEIEPSQSSKQTGWGFAAGPWTRQKSFIAGILALVIIVMATSLALFRSQVAQGQLTSWGSCPQNNSQYEVQFFVVGDWGREGNANQRLAAELMAQVARCLPPSFIISTGDNFYPSGMGGPLDRTFQKSFTDVYSARELQVPWYAVLGNHDYADNVDQDPATARCMVASLAECPSTDCCYSPIWQYTERQTSNDGRWHLNNGTVHLSQGDGLLDLMLFDSSPFIQKYRNEAWAKVPGGLDDQNPSLIKSQLAALLQASSARFKVVVGHHPARSFGRHCSGVHGTKGDCEDMKWIRKMNEQYGVSAYFNGHEHDQQHIKSPKESTHYIVTGAGSDTRKENLQEKETEEGSGLVWADLHQGFAAVGVTQGEMVVQYYTSKQGLTPAHVVSIPPNN